MVVLKRLIAILLACALAVQPVYADNGQMVTGRVEIYGGTYTFDSNGHMTNFYGGLE